MSREIVRSGWEQEVSRREAPYLLSSNSDGDTLCVVPKTDYQFDVRTNGTQEITLAAGIDAVAWKAVTLVTRIHAKNTWSLTAGLLVKTENVSIVPAEPDLLFKRVVEVVNSTSFTNSTAAPSLDIKRSVSPVGGMLRVYLSWTQGATAAGGIQTIALSVDLVGRYR